MKTFKELRSELQEREGYSTAKTPGGEVYFPLPKPAQSPTKIATPPSTPSPVASSSSSGIKGGPNNPPMASVTKTTSGAALPKSSGPSKSIAPKAPIAKRPAPISKPDAPIAKTIPTGAAAKPATPKPIATKTAQPAPKKEIVVDIRKETDPNAPGGPGGFVTGYGSSSGRTANIKRGFYDAPGTKTPSGVQSATSKMMPTQRLNWKEEMKTFKQLRKEIDESALDTTMDAFKSGLDSATFGQGKKAIAWGMSKIKGTDYEKELEKEKQRMEKGRERSPNATMAGDIAGGIINPFAGAYDFGKAAGEFANKNPTVNAKTDEIGKKVATAIDDSPEVNRAIKRPADYVPQRIKDQQQQQNAKPPLEPVNIKPKVPETKPEQKPVSGDQSAAKPKQDFKSKESIMNIQRELNKRGAKLKVDGIVGKQTAGAVRNLQSDLNKKGAGLKIDGDYGEKTHAALNSQRTNKPKPGITKLPYNLDPNKPKPGIAKLPYNLDPNKPKPGVAKTELVKKDDGIMPNPLGKARYKDNGIMPNPLGKARYKDDGIMPNPLGKARYKDDGIMPKSNTGSSPFFKKSNYL